MHVRDLTHLKQSKEQSFKIGVVFTSLPRHIYCCKTNLCNYLFRAAMKMANIDAVFDFMFTSPKNSDGVSEVLWLLCCI